MMVVLGLLLVTTAAATIAVQSTYFGLRATGHRTRQNHTQYISEAALLTGVDYAARLASCQNQRRVFDSPCPSLAEFNEPEYLRTAQLSDQEHCYRIPQAYLVPANDQTVAPIVNASCDAPDFGALGTCLAYEPFYVIDMELIEPQVALQAGQRVDDNQFYDLMVVLTARGRTRVPGDVGDSQDQSYRAISGARGAHESANDARAYVVVPGAERCPSAPANPNPDNG
jgi:hypothetical protein